MLIREKSLVLNQTPNLKSAEWGYNTDLYKLFVLVGDIAKRNNLKEEDLPGLIIFSDMQFDVACGNSYQTNLEAAKKYFKSLGYKSYPKIVFWNLKSTCVDFPATQKDIGVGLVSGFSPSLISSFINTSELSPISIVNSVLHSSRYQKVVDFLK